VEERDIPITDDIYGIGFISAAGVGLLSAYHTDVND